jgi:hypothetical protein
MEKQSRFMHALELIEKENSVRILTLGDLLILLGELGHGILILLLCLIFLQPIPLPGISTPIGGIIIILATLQFLNQAPWLPERFRGRPLPQKALHGMAEKARKLWSRLEKLLHPRMVFLTRARGFRFLNLLVIILSSFLLALPLPIPFTNTIPAIVIIGLSFAQLEDDGVLVLLSYLVSIGMMLFFFSMGAGVLKILERPWASYF